MCFAQFVLKGFNKEKSLLSPADVIISYSPVIAATEQAKLEMILSYYWWIKFCFAERSESSLWLNKNIKSKKEFTFTQSEKPEELQLSWNSRAQLRKKKK